MDEHPASTVTADLGRETPPVSLPRFRLRDPEPSADRFDEIGPDHPLYLLGTVLSGRDLPRAVRSDLLLLARANWPQSNGRHPDPSAEVAAQLNARGVSDRELSDAAQISVAAARRRMTLGKQRRKARAAHPVRQPYSEFVGYAPSEIDPRFRALLPRDPDVASQWSRAIREGSVALREAHRLRPDTRNYGDVVDLGEW
jgi:hypothetical protein